MKYLYIALLTIVSFVPVIALKTQVDERLTKKWVLEQPSSPLRITLSSNGENYDLENFSDGRVVAYRLGCVKESATGVKIKRRAKLKHVDIAPADPPGDKRYGVGYTIYADNDFYPCIQKKIKLAVLEVRFSNRPKWVAKLK
jgi:hypothetical protein